MAAEFPEPLQVSLAGFIAVVGLAAYAPVQRSVEPSKAAHSRPEWLDLVLRNPYSRSRLQIMNPNSGQQSVLRDFDMLSTKDTSGCVKEMRAYLERRKMPEHPYIGLESILHTEACRALVTPWYENGNILQFINKRVVGDARKLVLIMQIAQGLAHLHSLGIVHGNLYPANILVTDDEDIVLTDAGIYTEAVRLMLAPSGRVPLPHSAVYKSPRELDGEEVPTKSADVYSFASTCHAILTGQAPFFEVANPYQRVLKIAHPNGHRALPKPLSTSPNMWDLLTRCWSPEPTQRPTMDNVVYCLERVKYITNR